MFDVFGWKVEIPINEEKPVGNNEFKFDTRSLNSVFLLNDS